MQQKFKYPFTKVTSRASRRVGQSRVIKISLIHQTPRKLSTFGLLLLGNCLERSHIYRCPGPWITNFCRRKCTRERVCELLPWQLNKEQSGWCKYQRNFVGVSCWKLFFIKFCRAFIVKVYLYNFLRHLNNVRWEFFLNNTCLFVNYCLTKKNLHASKKKTT